MSLSVKQKEFWKAFKSRKYKYMLYGGAVASGKTILTLGAADELCQSFPGIRVGILRKSLATIRRNTIPSFNKILDLNGDPTRCYLNKSEWTYYYKNGSQIVLVEGDITTDPELNKLKGLELTGVIMEEANECQFPVFNLLKTRVGRYYNEKYNIPPFILLTCNPDSNWVKDVFYDPWSEEKLHAPYYFLPALPQDNEFLSQDYLDGLEELPGPEYERYVKGNWNFGGNPNQLIRFQYFKECKVDEERINRDPLFLGIDVAREGDDYSTLCFGDLSGILWFERYKFDSCVPLKNIVKLAMESYRIPHHNVAVDGIGLGASLIDLLEQDKIYVSIFKSSEGAQSQLEHFVFKNRRAEGFWMLRQDIEDKHIEICADKEFQRQALAIEYFVREKNIQIEAKDSIKKKLSYSPDTFDAAVIMNYLRHGAVHNQLSFGYFSNLMKGRGNTYYGSEGVNKTLVSQMVY